ncbi:unnamed protein product, partial [Larinioides sclopetarius]
MLFEKSIFVSKRRSKQAFLQFDITKNHFEYMNISRLSLLELEAFGQWSKRMVAFILRFGIHSPYVPKNPYFEGYAIRLLGFDCKMEAKLEKEELFLPPPYQTSCRDNKLSE